VSQNSQIKSFEIQAEQNGKWETIASGTTMGEWNQSITPVTSAKFRLVLKERYGFSGIREFQLFR
jgi:alpha-L-fucosidase